jgi:hypothetical protein
MCLAVVTFAIYRTLRQQLKQDGWIEQCNKQRVHLLDL